MPSGLNKYNGFWHHTLLGGYDFGSDSHPAVGYLVSAVVGIAVIGAAIFLIGAAVRWAASRRSAEHQPEPARQS